MPEKSSMATVFRCVGCKQNDAGFMTPIVSWVVNIPNELLWIYFGLIYRAILYSPIYYFAELVMIVKSTNTRYVFF